MYIMHYIIKNIDQLINNHLSAIASAIMNISESFSYIYKRSKVYNQFGNLPRHFYILDKKGNALYINDTCVDFLSSDSSLDLTNKLNTYDLIPDKEAQQIKLNNESVLKQQKEIIFQENFTYDKHETRTAISIKAPFRDFKRNISGILGVSFIQHENTYHSSGKIKLTPKRIECLYLLVKGYTYAEIAKTLHLSPRTIEHYMDDLYDKLNCNKRHELVAYALKIQEIKILLLTT